MQHANASYPLGKAPIFVAHYGSDGQLTFLKNAASDPDAYVNNLVRELAKP